MNNLNNHRNNVAMLNVCSVGERRLVGNLVRDVKTYLEVQEVCERCKVVR